MLALIRNQRGNAFIEAVFVLPILIVMFLGSIDIMQLNKSREYTQKIANDVAREAALTSSIPIAKSMAGDLSKQYFGNSSAVAVSLRQNGRNVTAHSSYQYKSKVIPSLVVNVNGQAIYPWWDRT